MAHALKIFAEKNLFKLFSKSSKSRRHTISGPGGATLHRAHWMADGTCAMEPPALKSVPWNHLHSFLESKENETAILNGDGDKLGLVWLKFEGSPQWPSQRVPDSCAPNTKSLASYQLFGTGKYVLVSRRMKSGITPFSVGWQRGYGRPLSENRFTLAVYQSCQMVKNANIIPWGWHNSETSGEYFAINKNHWLSSPPKVLDEVEACNCRLQHPSKALVCTNTHTCENVAMRVTCDGRICGSRCQNKAFHLRSLPKLVPFPTKDRGVGLRIAEEKKKGDFIIEYVGEVIDEKEMVKRIRDTNGEENYYIMQLSSGKYIDSRRMGNLARYINSSCSPNCELQKWIDSSTKATMIGIFALKDIEANEELTFNYNFTHFGSEGAASFECKCGSPNCIGTLDKRFRKRNESTHEEDLTEYERQRNENIRRNNNKLMELKIAQTAKMISDSAPKPRKCEKKQGTLPPPRAKSTRKADIEANKLRQEQENNLTDDDDDGNDPEAYKSDILTDAFERYHLNIELQPSAACLCEDLYVCKIKRKKKLGGGTDSYWKLFDKITGKAYPFKDCNQRGQYQKGTNQTHLRSVSALETFNWSVPMGTRNEYAEWIRQRKKER